MAAQPPAVSCFCPILFEIGTLHRRPFTVPLHCPHIRPSHLPSSPLRAILSYCTCPAQALVENYLLIYTVILGSHNGPLKQIIWVTNLWRERPWNWLLAYVCSVRICLDPKQNEYSCYFLKLTFIFEASYSLLEVTIKMFSDFSVTLLSS